MARIETPQMPTTEWPAQLVKLARRWCKANDANEGTDAQETRFEKAEAALNAWIEKNGHKVEIAGRPSVDDSYIDWINAVEHVLEMEDLLFYMGEQAEFGYISDSYHESYARLMANWS